MQPDFKAALSAPFADTDIEWRLQSANAEKGWGIAVPYVTNRAIQSRLDSVAGVENWKNEYIPWHGDGKKASQLCGISIYFESRGEWVTKYDGAENSDIEPVKGGLSDSMKRAAVQWGVGRYLYSMDTVFVDVETRGKSAVIKDSSLPKLDDAHQKAVRKVFGQKQAAAGEKPAPAGNGGGGTKQPAAEGAKPAQGDTQPAKNDTQPGNAVAQTAKNNAQPARDGPQSGNTVAPPAKNDPQSGNTIAQQAKNETQQPAAATATSTAVSQQTGAYCVVETASQPSVKGGSTSLRLKGRDGKAFIAFMQGEDPALEKGVWIENAVITKKSKDGLVFYTLDSYSKAFPPAA